MKNSRHPIILRGGVFVCIVMLLLTSCENFLKANQVKSEIEESIEIASSSPILYHIIADKDSGTVSPSQATLKKKQSVNLLFTPADGWSFICWEALDRTTGEPVPDAIKFENPQKLETKATILKPTENLMIHPKCNLVPKVIEITPKFDNSGCDQDRTITVTFNKSINLQTFNFDAISITTPEGVELFSENPDESFYDFPYFTNDNKTLNIPTTKGKFLLLPDGFDKNNTIYNSEKTSDDITVRIDMTSVRDTNDLAFSQMEPHTYRVNKIIDNAVPVITDIHIYSTSDTNDYFYKELTKDSYSTWSSSEYQKYKNGDFSRNHVSHLYITISAYDEQSGIGKIRIKETLKQTSNGIEAGLQTTTYQDFGNDVFITGIDDEGNPVYKLEYDFDSRNMNDGLYLITVSVLDNANNESETVEEYWVIKDLSMDPKLIFRTPTTNNKVSIKNIRIPEYNSEKNTYELNYDFGGSSDMANKTVIILNDSGDKYFKVNGVAFNSRRIINVYLQEENSDRIQVLQNCVKDTNDPYLGTTINNALKNYKLDTQKDTTIIISIEEESGLIKEFAQTFLKKVDILGFAGINPICSNFDSTFNDSDISYYIAYKYQESESSTPGEFVLNKYETNSFSEDGIYTVYVIRLCDKLFSPAGKEMKYYKGSSNSNNPPSITFPTVDPPVYGNGDISYKLNAKTAEFTLELENMENATQGYSYSVILERDNFYSHYFTPLSDDNKNVFKITVPSAHNYKIYLAAIDSDGKLVKKSSPIPASGSLSLYDKDNIPPTISYSFPINNTSQDYKLNIESNVFRSYGSYIGVYGYDVNVTDDYVPKIYFFYAPSSEKTGTYKTISKYPKVEVNVTAEDITKGYVNIPYDGIEYGYYNVYTLAYDCSGNYTFKLANGVIEYYTTANIPELLEQADSIKISCKQLDQTILQPFNLSKREDTSCLLSIRQLQNEKWVDSKIQEHMENWSYEISYDDYKNSFIKICCLYLNGGDNDSPNPITMQPLFVYTGYYEYLSTNSGSTSPAYCKSKTWMPVANGWQIFADRPAFVHTLYCSKNLTQAGTFTTAEAALEWETRAQETGIVYNDGTGITFSYTDENLAGVPEGYYYTTICHFADGTVVMSEVKLKD